VQRRRTARTFGWLDGARVVGYYSITAHVLDRAELPARIGRGRPERIPAVLLARLALDRGLHGSGWGSALLAEALGRIVVATDIVAARFVVVEGERHRGCARTRPRRGPSTLIDPGSRLRGTCR